MEYVSYAINALISVVALSGAGMIVGQALRHPYKGGRR